VLVGQFKIFDLPETPRSDQESQSKIKIKGSGQECPLYMGVSVLWRGGLGVTKGFFQGLIAGDALFYYSPAVVIAAKGCG
jgi:hypothetical protein